MLKPAPFFIGTRYILARKDNRFISFTSLISMAGLTLGVLALIIVLSVFNGSQGVMLERTLITVPHGDIRAQGRFPEPLDVAEALRRRPGITEVAPYLQTQAMLSRQGRHQVTEVKGILPAAEQRVSRLEDNMIRGSLDDLQPGSHGIILGRALAANLGVNTGDTVNLVVPEIRGGSNFDLGMYRFTVAGIFDVQFTIGANLALVHLEDSLALMGLDAIEQAVHLRLEVADVDAAAQTVAETLAWLEGRYPDTGWRGEDWSVTEANLFNALKMERIMTSFMLMMIVAIGAFNIVSTLVMVVTEKRADIAILRTMGAGRRTIMAIFMVQGILVGIMGIVLGAVLGILVAGNFNAVTAFAEDLISPDNLYVISSLPAELQGLDVAVVCAGALAISFLATLYPAWRASRIHPAEVLRYE